jgi:hypothetical protein
MRFLLTPVMIQFIADQLSVPPDWEQMTKCSFLKRYPRCQQYLELSPLGAQECLQQKYHYATRQSSLSPLSTVFVPLMGGSSLVQSASKESRIADLESSLKEMQAIVRSQRGTSVLLRGEIVRLLEYVESKQNDSADDLTLQINLNELKLVDEVTRVDEA